MEMSQRSAEALTLYEPLPMQNAFHVSMAPERLIRGSNRGGKTLPSAVEIGRACTGQDPFNRYPAKNGRAYLVGKDGKHCGQVMFRKLFRSGAFHVIRDQKTGLWRSYRPWEPGDLSRKHERRDSPPLIPQRFIKSVSWEKKKENQPTFVVLNNGWEVGFYSSLGKPPQGVDVDLVWFDEEIVDPDWYPEMAARLLDRAGRFIWSATPEAGTDRLYELHERCNDQRGFDQPSAEEFVILLDDNKHIGDDVKDAFREKLKDDADKAATKIGGEFAIMTYKVFPEYSKHLHVVPYFEIPDNWTRYMVVDPGYQICAVLFAAVPPPAEGDYVYLYDELYIRNCNANMFADAVANKVGSQVFWAFIIDAHGGRITQMAEGRSIEDQYAELLAERKVVSVKTKSGFCWCPDHTIETGINAVRSWLRVGDGGYPKLRILSDRMKNFDHEIKRYHYRRNEKREVTDKPDQRRRTHLMDTLRYLAMFDPGYHKINKKKAIATGAIVAFRKKEAARKKARGKEMISFGPSSNVYGGMK